MSDNQTILKKLDVISSEIARKFYMYTEFGKAGVQFENETGVGYFIEVYSSSPLFEDYLFDQIMTRVIDAETHLGVDVSLITHRFVNTLKYYPEKMMIFFEIPKGTWQKSPEVTEVCVEESLPLAA